MQQVPSREQEPLIQLKLIAAVVVILSLFLWFVVTASDLNFDTFFLASTFTGLTLVSVGGLARAVLRP